MDILDVYSELSLGSSSRLSAPFIGKGHIWIDNTYNADVIHLARQIISDAIFHTAPGQLSILGFDADLSGVFAPFSSLSNGETRVLEFISDNQELKTQLKYVEQQIFAVQNVIQGRTENLIDFRAEIKRPVESYKLVVLVLDVGLMNQDTLATLSLLLRSGPACGISFLIVSTTYLSRQSADGKEIELKVKSLATNITVLEVDGNTVTNGSQSIVYSPVSASEIINRCRSFIASRKTTELPSIPFSELHAHETFWQDNTINGVSFVVGKYGTENMEITIGDEVNQRHNAIITGAVGQGKSNLISVLIHSMCLRYSPKELELYLLDFKEGVTFKAFSNIGQDAYLPHAKALGLESDVSFGVAVLQSLYKTYQRRMEILKDNNVKSIRDLRLQHPEMEMPRIVVVIDEFQMMFGDDIHVGQEIADMLEKSVRLFRAAGIHFILASQTLIGNMALANKRDSLFSQVPIRIALKNSVSESQQVLSLTNSAAGFLRPREAIVNLDYGEISQNKKTIITYADESLLMPLRQQMWERARAYTTAPYVFESERRITISSGLESIKALIAAATTPTAMIGNCISIDGERVLIPMSNEPGRNIAILGTPDNDCDQATGILQGIAASLALQHPKGDARFIFCDFRNNDMPYDKCYPHFARFMEDAGYFIESIDRSGFEQTMKALSEDEAGNDSIYVFGAALDRWEYEKDPYGQGSALKSLVENAPAKRIHFIGWWIKPSSFSAQVAGYGQSDAFNTKIFLRIDERSVQSLTSPFVRWTAQTNRALISDSVEFAEEITFIPYAPLTKDDVSIAKAKRWSS